MRVIDGIEAYSDFRRNKTGWWSRHQADSPPAASRTRQFVFLPEVQARFGLRLEDKIFTIGSCFARHIERHLEKYGYRFETLNPKFYVAPDECTSPQGFYNRFTTHSMLNELKWGLGLEEFPEAAYYTDEKGRWQDGQLLASFATLERAREVRANLRAVTSTMASSDVLILTLGLVEAWHDAATGHYMNVAPPQAVVRANPNRFSVHILDYRANYECLEQIRDIARAANPALRIFLTVSPVPLGATFSGQDIANSYSKSTLRAVAGDFATAHDDVQYFPSYEIVTESMPIAAWEEDAVHVRTEMVANVIGYFMSKFLPKEQATQVDRETPRRKLEEKVQQVLAASQSSS